MMKRDAAANPDLIDRALDACSAWNALGGEVRDVDGARFVRNQLFTDVPGTNRVSHINAASPDEIARLHTLVQREFGNVTPAFEVDHRTPPPFEARLVVDGYQAHESLVMLLEGELRGTTPSCDVRPILDADDWRAWEVLSAECNLGYPVRSGTPAGLAEAAVLSASRRAKCPPLRYYAAYVDGAPAGLFSSWEGVSGIGIVENLSVREEMRGRGIATALVHACVAAARASRAGPVALTCNPLDWPKAWYARLGFRAVAMQRAYTAE
ncbi:MAG: GNAT family N-acetyltransferase [Gemmatimonadaceae bacterium]